MSSPVPVTTANKVIRTVGRYRWTVCALLFFSTALSYTDRQVLGLLKPVLLPQLHWTETDFGDIVACFSLLYAFGYVGVGRLMDKIGVKIGLAASVGSWSLFACMHALMSSVLGFKIARGCLGLAEGGNFPAAIKTVSEWFPTKERALATGVFNAGSNVGAVFAPAVVPIIVMFWGWRSVFSRQAGGGQLRVIGSMLDVLVVPEQLNQVLALMVDPRIKIVTLTVTEKGYCQDAATGALDETNKAIIADLANPAAPRTAPGLLSEAIRLRRAAAVAPFTILVCDNLPQNGATARRIVIRFAELRDQDLGKYIADNISFPCTMVDRITPATQDEDRKAIADGFGVEDAWPVVCERLELSVSNRKQGTSGNAEEPLGTAGNRVLGT